MAVSGTGDSPVPHHCHDHTADIQLSCLPWAKDGPGSTAVPMFPIAWVERGGISRGISKSAPTHHRGRKHCAVEARTQIPVPHPAVRSLYNPEMDEERGLEAAGPPRRSCLPRHGPCSCSFVNSHLHAPPLSWLFKGTETPGARPDSDHVTVWHLSIVWCESVSHSVVSDSLLSHGL